MIFDMLDQAQHERDVNIAHFLLQQSIIPGSGYNPPHGMALAGDDSVNGHWGMEKLFAYIATIREKFHPTLTPEASGLLENHYSLCRRQENGQTLITVRFLE
jgi:DNA replicative helicase MCM subunit Mcm2 (Cdc46/Mcm family)